MILSTTHKPLVSVVLASYNHESFIGEAVHSVLNQSYSNLELIVVDDGSSDGSAQILKQIDDPRLKVVLLAENRRQHPRNTGAALATGKYIAFQNSDDIWHPDKVAQQVAFLESSPQSTACFTGVGVVDDQSKSLKNTWLHSLFTHKNWERHALLRQFFDVGNCFCISSAMLRLADFKSLGGFRESLVQLSDFDLWVQLAGMGEIHLIQRELTHMRLLPGKNLSTPTPPTLRRSVVEQTQVLRRYIESPLFEQLSRIFPDMCEVGEKSGPCTKVDLALRAIHIDSPAHHCFADYALATALDHHKSRAAVMEVYGPHIYYFFLKHRARLETQVHPEA